MKITPSPFVVSELFKTKQGHSAYHLIFKSRYEMSMFFLRYQEFYESINPEFRGQSFYYLDYMSWYTEYTNSHMFTYTKDFIGYNLPSSSIIECYGLVPSDDYNKYDEMMIKLYLELSAKSKKFYIIGTIRKDTTFRHELAHALYYLEPAYKKQMDALTNALPKKLRRGINNVLSTIYSESVLDDETQAYMSTNSYMTGMSELPGFLSKTGKYEIIFNEWLVRTKCNL